MNISHPAEYYYIKSKPVLRMISVVQKVPKWPTSIVSVPCIPHTLMLEVYTKVEKRHGRSHAALLLITDHFLKKGTFFGSRIKLEAKPSMNLIHSRHLPSLPFSRLASCSLRPLIDAVKIMCFGAYVTKITGPTCTIQDGSSTISVANLPVRTHHWVKHWEIDPMCHTKLAGQLSL